MHQESVGVELALPSRITGHAEVAQIEFNPNQIKPASDYYLADEYHLQYLVKQRNNKKPKN